jgi:hypothetical protein
MRALSRFIGACFVAAVLTLGLNAAIADGLIPAPGGISFPFSRSISISSTALSITNTGTGDAIDTAASGGGNAIFADVSTGGAAAGDFENDGSGPAISAIQDGTGVGPLTLVPSGPPSTTTTKGNFYVNSTTNSLYMSNGTVFRRTPVGFGPTAMTSGVLAVTVETGTVGCIGADTATGIACTCACSGTTCTVTCAAGGSATAAGFYY